jgi:hypothetical protein
VGAIRAKVYHPTAGGPSVSDLFAFSDVEIGDVRIREAVSRGLAAYMAEQEVRCGRFYQVGGFAVAARFRGSALAPVLALAANAWRDHLGLYGGCTFATLTNGVADLDRRLGAFPLNDGSAELPPFLCHRHRAYARVLATEPGRYEARLADTVHALAAWVTDTVVVVPE